MKKTIKDQCIVPNCTNKAATKKHKLCHSHRAQLYRDGVVQTRPLKKYRKYDVIKFV